MTTKRKKGPSRSGPKKSKTIEWVGGTVLMPADVTGEGEPYRPEALFWMSDEGADCRLHRGEARRAAPDGRH